MKAVRLPALRTGRLKPPGNIPGTHFCWRLNKPQGHIAARRIMSMKNSNGTTGNQTHNLLVCSTVPQPTAPQCAPVKVQYCTEKYGATLGAQRAHNTVGTAMLDER